MKALLSHGRYTVNSSMVRLLCVIPCSGIVDEMIIIAVCRYLEKG